MMGYSENIRHYWLCSVCQEEKDKREYYEWQSRKIDDLEARNKLYPVLEYCDRIRGIS